jgi:hypothetical protein
MERVSHGPARISAPRVPDTPSVLANFTSRLRYLRSWLRRLPTCRRPQATFYLSASGDSGIPGELRARRKPSLKLRNDGRFQARFADRQFAAS